MKTIKRHILNHSGYRLCGKAYPASETSQQEPSLHDLLVRYQNGLDISNYITQTAVKATAEQQFANRVGKVDPLTEVPEYINRVFRNNGSVETNAVPTETSPTEPAPIESAPTDPEK